MFPHDPHHRTAMTPVIKPTSPGLRLGDAPPFDRKFRRRAILLLCLIYTCSYLDRQILNILAETIKVDLRLQDWQIGLMSGLAFALLYSLLGLPVARYAERADRPKLLAVAITVWSLATTACGFAYNFVQIVSARIAVGAAEASCTPAAHSLISEYTPRSERASALAFYSLGIPFGTLIGLGLGGILSDYFGWRAAFMVLGLPGLLLALLTYTSLREPRRSLATDASEAAATSLIQALAALSRIPSFRLMALGATAACVTGYGIAPFLASFFFRTHGAELASLAAAFGLKPLGFLGLALGLASGVPGLVGTWFGGRLADIWARRNASAYLLLPAITTVLALPCFVMAFFASDLVSALLWKAFGTVLYSAWYGPIYAAAHSVVSPNQRATVSATILLVTNLIGLGLGPLAVGICSDAFNDRLGLGPADGLRLALIASTVFLVSSGLLFWGASRKVLKDTVS